MFLLRRFELFLLSYLLWCPLPWCPRQQQLPTPRSTTDSRNLYKQFNAIRNSLLCISIRQPTQRIYMYTSRWLPNIQKEASIRLQAQLSYRDRAIPATFTLHEPWLYTAHYYISCSTTSFYPTSLSLDCSVAVA